MQADYNVVPLYLIICPFRPRMELRRMVFLPQPQARCGGSKYRLSWNGATASLWLRASWSLLPLLLPLPRDDCYHQKLYNDKFRLQMSSVEFITLGKGRLHFGGGISGIQLQGRPFIVYLLSERIQLGIPDCAMLLRYRYTSAWNRYYVDMILFGKLYQFDKERGDHHSTSRMYPSNRVPLQFRDAVAYTDHSHTQFAGLPYNKPSLPMKRRSMVVINWRISCLVHPVVVKDRYSL